MGWHKFGSIWVGPVRSLRSPIFVGFVFSGSVLSSREPACRVAHDFAKVTHHLAHPNLPQSAQLQPSLNRNPNHAFTQTLWQK